MTTLSVPRVNARGGGCGAKPLQKYSRAGRVGKIILLIDPLIQHGDSVYLYQVLGVEQPVDHHPSGGREVRPQQLPPNPSGDPVVIQGSGGDEVYRFNKIP